MLPSPVKLMGKLLLRRKPMICYLFPRSLSSISELSLTPDQADNPESPDLPTWLQHNQSSASKDPGEDDFVMPSLSSLFAKPVLRTEKVAKILMSRPNDADIVKVNEILQKGYTSPDDVVQALNESDVKARDDLVLHILKRFSNDWVAALGFFTWAKHQTGCVLTPKVYDLMVDVLGKCKKFTLMWELVEEMRGLDGYVSLTTMTKVMRRFAKARQYENAIEAFREIERFGVTRDVAALNVLMGALSKECSVEHARSVFLEFKDSIPPDSNTFQILIHGHCKARMLEEARRTMEDMEKHGFQPCAISYTCFIEAYCKEKDFRNVDIILEEMQKKGCKQNVVSYTILMHALGKAKQTNEALEVYEKMKRDGCVPDASFYASLIFILSSSGRIKDAWDVFRAMGKEGVGPNLLVYNTMIASACAHWQGSHAFELLQKMEQDGIKPDVKTYAPVLKLCCKNKSMRVLKLVLRHMSENEVSLDLGTYELLVRGLCMSGKFEEACLFFQDAVSKGVVRNGNVYKQLVENLQKHSMTELKEKMEKLMSQATAN